MADQINGQGGSYKINESGERELVDRTKTPEETSATTAAATDAEKTKPKKKGN